jgi:ankyrin repeat protein
MLIPDKKVSKNPFIGFSESKKRKIFFNLIYNNKLKNVELLLQLGVDPNTLDNGVFIPLYRPSKKGYAEMVKLLLKYGARHDPLEGEEGSYRNRSPIHWAAYNGHLDVVEVLLNSGVDINLEDFEGITPISLATSNKKTDIVKFLVDKGADVDIEDTHGFTPLYYSVYYNYPEITDLLLSKGKHDNYLIEGYSMVFYVFKKKWYELLEVLLKHGYDPNSTDRKGVPMMYYAKKVPGYGGSVELLNRYEAKDDLK